MADQRKRGGMKQGAGQGPEAKKHQSVRPESASNNKVGGQKRGEQQSPETSQNADQSPDRQDQAKNAADQEYANQAEEGGGEESKHGRKHKGNVDDT